ncbi:MAG: hypothetical protein ACI4TB_08970 [Lachnospiraceae bacterium]
MKSSKSSLFLMELIISILFFSLASAACIQLFVKAHLMDIRTKEQNQAVIWSQNLSSLWQASSGDLLAVFNQLSDDYDNQYGCIYLTNNGEQLILYFNQDWEFIGANAADIVYRVELSDCGYDDATSLSSAEITFFKGDESFYTLQLTHHPAMEGGSTHE